MTNAAPFIIQTLRRNCGQIAVAHLTGALLDQVTRIIGHKRGTKTAELVRVIRMMGFNCPDRISTSSWLYSNGIAQVRERGRSRKRWHWIAVKDGVVYDGERSGPMPLDEYRAYMSKAYNKTITSFLPVYGLERVSQ